MSDPDHVTILHQGRAAVERWIVGNPSQRFDLSKMSLQVFDFSGWNLENVNLNFSNLEKATFTNTHLTGASFENATLNQVDFSKANLNAVNFRDANLRHSIFKDATLKGTDFYGATLTGAFDLPKCGLREAALVNVNFSNCGLEGANLSGQTLTRSRFDGAKLKGANFENTSLRETSFIGARMDRINLTNSSLQNADLTGADLSHATLNGSDFYEALVNRTNFYKAAGLAGARNLHLVRFAKDQGDVKYFEFIEIPKIESLISWERIRFFGRLPLFGASYAALIAIPFLYYFLDLYNRKIDVVREWASKESVQANYSVAAKTILDRLHHEPIPSLSLALLVSTFLLGAGATIFALICPPRIREFSREQWKDELGHSLILYLPLTWWHFWLRLLCVILYVAGGIGVLFVMGSKLWNVFHFIIANG